MELYTIDIFNKRGDSLGTIRRNTLAEARYIAMQNAGADEIVIRRFVDNRYMGEVK